MGRQTGSPLALHMCPDTQDPWFLCCIWSAASQGADSHRGDACQPWLYCWKALLGQLFQWLTACCPDQFIKTSKKQTNGSVYTYNMRITSLKCNICYHIIFYWALTRHWVLCLTWVFSCSCHSHLLRGSPLHPHLTDEETEAQRRGVICPDHAVLGVPGTQTK